MLACAAWILQTKQRLVLLSMNDGHSVYILYMGENETTMCS